MTNVNPHELDCIELDEPEQIDSLRELDVGDRVLIDERRRPLTVTKIGTRTLGDERIDAEVTTPIVAVMGHWDGAKGSILTHQVNRMDVREGEFVPVLEETDTIVDESLGRERDVRRTHVVGSKGRTSDPEARDSRLARMLAEGGA